VFVSVCLFVCLIVCFFFFLIAYPGGPPILLLFVAPFYEALKGLPLLLHSLLLPLLLLFTRLLRGRPPPESSRRLVFAAPSLSLSELCSIIYVCVCVSIYLFISGTTVSGLMISLPTCPPLFVVTSGPGVSPRDSLLWPC